MPQSTRMVSGSIPEEEEVDPPLGSPDEEQQPLENHDNSDSRRSESTMSRESWAGDEASSNRSNNATASGNTTQSPPPPPNDNDEAATPSKGRLTKREIYIVGAIAIAVIAAIVVVAVVVTGGSSNNDAQTNQEENDSSASLGPVPTMAPTVAFTKMEQIETIVALLGNLTSTNKTVDMLPLDENYYDGLFEDATQPAAVRAMSWIINKDPRVHGPMDPFLAIRYALVVMYYNNGGTYWIHSENWLTEADTCDWAGVTCDTLTQTKLEQLDLQSNNLTNSIPNEIALLRDARAIWLRRNNLSGTLPGKAFFDLKVLQDLYVESNKLTGRIPGVMARNAPPNGRLKTLFIQQNLFTGLFPAAFCVTTSEGTEPLLDRFGLDCDRNGCICCIKSDNCF